VTLPDEVVEELGLEPGSEIAFKRGPQGNFFLERADASARPSREQIRQQIRAAALSARTGVRPEYAQMTTDEYMAFIRG
jgi:bifunctional DNA-binding transcriptional regulator/antitoxin component of YhaV-PrlF toxin-antitoxin module